MKKLLKKNNAFSMADVIIAVFVLAMFVGVIGSMYYNIAVKGAKIKLDAIATHYAIKYAEAIDEISYDDVNGNLTSYLNSKYSMDNSFTLSTKVEDYKIENSPVADMAKIVTIKIDYSYSVVTGNYELRKLKMREL